MAGGPSTPALAAAVSNAGGLGSLPAGYLTAERFAEDIAAARSMTGGPIAVNLFVPQPCVAGAEEIDAYREQLVPLARRYGVEPGRPRPDDDHWQAKLDVVADTAPEAVSFTFGCPERAVLQWLRGRGVLTIVTVSSAAEAALAVAAGADALVVQGPAAGGHRSMFAPDRDAPTTPLLTLLDQVMDLGVPVVAAGGLGDATAVRYVLGAGAVAAQVGTALLLCDEAGDQRRAPSRSARQAVHRHRGDPGLLRTLCAQPGQRIHCHLQRGGAAGVSATQPDHRPHPVGVGGRGRSPCRHPLGRIRLAGHLWRAGSGCRRGTGRRAVTDLRSAASRCQCSADSGPRRPARTAGAPHASKDPWPVRYLTCRPLASPCPQA